MAPEGGRAARRATSTASPTPTPNPPGNAACRPVHGDARAPEQRLSLPRSLRGRACGAPAAMPQSHHRYRRVRFVVALAPRWASRSQAEPGIAPPVTPSLAAIFGGGTERELTPRRTRRSPQLAPSSRTRNRRRSRSRANRRRNARRHRGSVVIIRMSLAGCNPAHDTAGPVVRGCTPRARSQEGRARWCLPAETRRVRGEDGNDSVPADRSAVRPVGRALYISKPRSRMPYPAATTFL